MTFKLPVGAALADDFDLRSAFARAYGFSLGKVAGSTLEERAAGVRELAAGRDIDVLHVWQRDLCEPGFHGYEPAMTEAAKAAEAAIREGFQNSPFMVPESGVLSQGSGPPSPASDRSVTQSASPNSARAGQLVLDCILVESDQWWIGYHRAVSIPSRWPGGMFDMELPADAVSRAYLKMEEALAWSRMPLRAQNVWAEIGSAPGGASQALLRRGLRVIGIDPADMDPVVLANPNFTHWKKRGADVRRREFRPVRYLAADINVAPSYTLETVENIVTHPEVQIRGLLLTLKLLDWKLAEEVPAYLDRVRSWGYSLVRARQLHHNRQEICVAATRKMINDKRLSETPCRHM